MTTFSELQIEIENEPLNQQLNRIILKLDSFLKLDEVLKSMINFQ